MEQPELGVSSVGVDGLTIGLSWTWELGWTLRASSRLSGSDQWRTTTYPALSPDEVLEVVQCVVAEGVGLV